MTAAPSTPEQQVQSPAATGGSGEGGMRVSEHEDIAARLVAAGPGGVDVALLAAAAKALRDVGVLDKQLARAREVRDRIRRDEQPSVTLTTLAAPALADKSCSRCCLLRLACAAMERACEEHRGGLLCAVQTGQPFPTAGKGVRQVPVGEPFGNMPCATPEAVPPSSCRRRRRWRARWRS